MVLVSRQMRESRLRRYPAVQRAPAGAEDILVFVLVLLIGLLDGAKDVIMRLLQHRLENGVKGGSVFRPGEQTLEVRVA